MIELSKEADYIPSDLGEEKAKLRFELFDWLKEKNLTVCEATSLLEVTSQEIKLAYRHTQL